MPPSNSVAGAAVATHEPGPDHAVDQAGDAARRQEHAFGELAHAEVPVGCGREVQEDLVPAQRQVPLALELVVELLDQGGLGGEQGLPRAETAVVDPAHRPTVAVSCGGNQ